MQGYEYSKACFELPLGWATTWHTQFLRTLNFDFETLIDFEPKWQQCYFILKTELLQNIGNFVSTLKNHNTTCITFTRTNLLWCIMMIFCSYSSWVCMTKDSVNIAARAYLILVVLVVEDGASIFRTTASVSKIP